MSVLLRVARRWSRRALLVAACAAPARGSTAAPTASDDADSVLARSARAFATADLDRRQHALEALEGATIANPQRADVWLARGRANLEQGHFTTARGCFAHAARLTPEDADAWRALALAWRLDWLASVERASLDQAIDACTRTCRLSPGGADDWTMLATLLLLRGRAGDAIAAGLSGRAADPEAPGPWLVLGAALFRTGQVALADSAFRRGMLGLADDLCWRFRDPAVLHVVHRDAPDSAGANPETASVPTPERDRAADAEWAAADPDLTTPENEALLDYRTRVAIATYLFRERGAVVWDRRADLFARYGPPSGIHFNPAGSQLGWDQDLEFRFPHMRGQGYPYNLLVWDYAELGMQVELWDRSLMHHYELPVSTERPMDPRPDPAALAGRADLTALGAGRGVFRVLPPGTRPLALGASAVRVPQGEGTRVLAWVVAKATPLDSLQGAWALAAADGRVLARGTSMLGPSACDAAGSRVAGFDLPVAPGRYRIDLTASGAHGWRGIRHLAIEVEPPDAGLEMSDLVLVCGSARLAVGPEGVRIEPRTTRVVSGNGDLTVYYELEHLRTGPDGQARFVYTYSVHPIEPGDDPGMRRRAVLEFSREESTVGPHRRQFVSVPVGRLAAGRYELRMAVRDVASGREIERSLPIVRGEHATD